MRILIALLWVTEIAQWIILLAMAGFTSEAFKQWIKSLLGFFK